MSSEFADGAMRERWLFLRTAKNSLSWSAGRCPTQDQIRKSSNLKLLRRETVSRRRRILLTWFQLCRRKVRVIWRIWKVLRFHAKAGPMPAQSG